MSKNIGSSKPDCEKYDGILWINKVTKGNLKGLTDSNEPVKLRLDDKVGRLARILHNDSLRVLIVKVELLFIVKPM